MSSVVRGRAGLSVLATCALLLLAGPGCGRGTAEQGAAGSPPPAAANVPAQKPPEVAAQEAAQQRANEAESAANARGYQEAVKSGAVKPYE